MKTKKTKQNATAVVGATPSVLGATPLSELPFHGAARRQKGAAAEEDLGNAAPGVKKPATLKAVNFHRVPPRTQIVEKENAGDGTDGADIRFKERSKAEGAPAGLGEISASIWAKTSMSKGGAKDPTAAPIAKAASIMAERMDIEQDDHAALMSTEGFRAYADAMIWGVRAPGEADDAPLDENDPLQVRSRLREVWRSWRKLPVATQRQWADNQLGQDIAAAMKRAGGFKPQAKGKRAAATAAEALGGSTKRKPKKADDWNYNHAPKHKLSKVAAEPEQEDEEQQQRPTSGRSKKDKQPKKSMKSAAAESDREQGEAAADREYDNVDADDGKLDEEYRRAEALRFSKVALLSEMRNWEAENEEQEAAAAAGVTVDQLRKQRKEAAAAAEQEAAAEADETGEAAEDQQEGGDAGAGSSRAAASRGKKRKATSAVATKKSSGPEPNRSRRPSRKQQQSEEDEDEQMADASDDEGDLAAETALDKALAAADDSDEDTAGADESDSSDEEEEQQPPTKKAKKAAAATKPKETKPKAGKAVKDTTGKKDKAPKASVKKANAAEKPAAADLASKQTDSKKRKPAVEKPVAAGEQEPTADEAAPAAAAAAGSGGGRQRKKSSDKAAEPGNRKQKVKSAAAVEGADGDEAGPFAFAAAGTGSGGGRQRSKASTKGQRQQKEEEGQQEKADDDDDEPAVSGAGKSSGPRRGRSAGGAQAARIDHLEKSLFSNTRRSSYGRADSPGLARTISEAREALAAEAAQPKSRLGKSKDKK